jgi:CheY-like chemotaxis protein
MVYGKQIKIMIVGDNRFNIDEVVRLASSPIMIIQQATDSEWAIEQFDRSPCHILVLCHSLISKSENFYNSFIMFSEKAMETPHQTILLCDGRDSSLAHEICHKQAMDDYVIYKPLYDVHRVRFSISLAMDRLENKNYKNIIEDRLTNMISNMSEIRSNLSNHIDKVSQCQKIMNTQDKSIDNVLDLGISRIKKKLEALSGNGVIQINDPIGFNNEYNKIKKECIEESNIEHDDSLSWIETIKSDFTNVRDSASIILDHQKSVDIKSPWKILVVEDEEVNKKMMEMMLSKEGYSVKVASDGLSAINIAENWTPHLIFMDIKMPKMNGLKVTQKLKSNKKFKDTHIIMLTGHSEEVVVKECLKAGASGYMVKPAKKEELLDRIATYRSMEQR